MYDCILRFMLGVILALGNGAGVERGRSVSALRDDLSACNRDLLSGAAHRLGELLVEVEQDGARHALVLLHEAADVAERVRLRLEQPAHDGNVDEAAAVAIDVEQRVSAGCE